MDSSHSMVPVGGSSLDEWVRKKGAVAGLDMNLGIIMIMERF